MTYIRIEKYQSNRLPEFYSCYQNQCLEILGELNFTDIEFLMSRACRDSANNCGGNFRIQEFKTYQESCKSVKLLEEFFIENPNKIYYYEGVYNALNYVKTYISTMLHNQKQVVAKEDLFRDFEEKKKLVTANLKSISEYLLGIRTQVLGSRLCIANHALSKNANKSGEFLSKNQISFISSIAFGSTIEKLKEENYSEAERLLFVPKCKVLKK